METVQIQTAQNVVVQFEVAGVADRILASVIDYALIVCYWIVLVFTIIFLERFISSTGLIAFFFLVPILFYDLLLEVFWNGQSIGKRLRKIRVARLDGQEPTLGNYLVRWLFRFVDFTLSSGVVALLCVVLGGKGQRLGDMAAGTTVVSLRQRADLRDTLFSRIEESHTVTFPQVDRLNETEVETAKEVYNYLVTESRSREATKIGEDMKMTLEAKMGVRAALPPVLFLRTVVEDYNHTQGRV